MSFSNFGIVDFIAKGIYQLMIFTHRLVPSWGLCIILVSLFIYGIMYPLTFKGMSSMKRMQALQPKIEKLKEQYKNNPQKMNKELMDLYKENRINPLGGCLPLLLQMPIFIGLYQVLWRSVFFKGAGFLWIKDLSQPDRLFILPFNLPFIGNEINILPIFMMIVMVMQQKMSMKNMVISDPAQLSQQRMMLIFMPILLGVLFYKFASGLNLYITVFYLLSTITQWKMSKVKVV
jgi:YidC/Oxa1 family membrane protein insertase